MITPIKRDLKIYKGATFIFEFRIRVDGAAVDVSAWTWTLNAAVDTGGAAVISASSANSPAEITVDSTDEYLVRIELSDTATAAISETGQLIYSIDATNDDSEVERRFTGRIDLIESVV